jgi:hypothetical protein
LIESVKDKFLQARDALTEFDFDAQMQLLLSHFDSTHNRRRTFCENSAAVMKAYFNGQLPLRRRWAHYARVNLLTLGANTTQRTEGFFSKLQAKGCSKNTDIGYLLRSLDDIEISVEVNTLTETRRAVSVGQEAISRRFQNILDLSKTFLSRYALKRIDGAVSLAVLYDVTYDLKDLCLECSVTARPNIAGMSSPPQIIPNMVYLSFLKCSIVDGFKTIVHQRRRTPKIHLSIKTFLLPMLLMCRTTRLSKNCSLGAPLFMISTAMQARNWLRASMT